MSCECKMVTFFEETEWSFSKQAMVTCWGSYMKLIQGRLGWRGWHVCLSGSLDWIMTLNKKSRVVINAKNCRPNPPLTSLIYWKFPSRPWSRVHIIFAGSIKGQMFLVVIDAHSKWLEIHPVPTITAQATIQCLGTTFAQFGLPERVVSENGQPLSAGNLRICCIRMGLSMWYLLHNIQLLMCW